eukprot:GHVS01066900.1.p1 GENE.GHVS01066900.1~~GHVS01066900.1.p1  ORF type:complete len:103 (+),score=35.63 GHVS01066900.1:190-498(+)
MTEETTAAAGVAVGGVGMSSGWTTGEVKGEEECPSRTFRLLPRNVRRGTSEEEEEEDEEEAEGEGADVEREVDALESLPAITTSAPTPSATTSSLVTCLAFL